MSVGRVRYNVICLKTRNDKTDLKIESQHKEGRREANL